MENNTKLSNISNYIILSQTWFETDQNKNGWDTFGWNKPDNYELDKVLDTDIFGHPILGMFTKKL